MENEIKQEKKEELECPKCKKMESKFWVERYGECFWCQHKRQERESLERLKKEAVETGETSNEDYVICPYCGTDNGTDDLNESTNTRCCECNKKFYVEVNYSCDYSTSKVED
jgi:hypothetical protein